MTTTTRRPAAGRTAARGGATRQNWPRPIRRYTQIRTGMAAITSGSTATPDWEARSTAPAQFRSRPSAFRRHHLAADFSARMSLRVQVDVPFSGREILRLLGCKCRLSLDGIFGRAALLREPDKRRSVLALGGGPMEVRHGNGSGQSAVCDGPGHYTRRRIVRQLSHPHAGRFHRRYLLGAYQWDLKVLG